MDISKIMLSTVAAAAAAGLFAFDQVPFKSGESVAFLGDSITELGVKQPMGYVNLVADGLKRAGVEISVVPAGVSGNQAPHMLARLDKDVIEKKPQWMFLSCGVNDCSNGMDNPGIPLEKYQADITAILDKCKDAGIQVIILTATPVVEDPDHVANKNLIPYNEFLRKIGKERELAVIDLGAYADKLVSRKSAKNKKKNIFTVDGTHPSPLGNINIALFILKNLGMTPEMLNRNAAEWQNRPDAWQINIKISLSIQEKARLDKILPPGMTIEQWATEAVLKQLPK